MCKQSSNVKNYDMVGESVPCEILILEEGEYFQALEFHAGQN